MLQSMLTTVQQQKAKLVFWVLTGVCLLLLARIADSTRPATATTLAAHLIPRATSHRP